MPTRRSVSSSWLLGVAAGTLLILAIVVLFLPDSGMDWLWFSLVYLLITIGAIALHGYSGRVDFLNPLFMFLVVLYLYSVSSGLYVDESGATYTGDPISDESRYKFYFACLVGAAATAAGSVAVRYFPLLNSREISCSTGEARKRFFAHVCVMLGVLIALPFAGEVLTYFNPTDVAGYSDWALESRQLRHEDTAAGLRDVVSFYLPIILLLAGCTAIALSKGCGLTRLIAIIVIGLYLMTNTMAGKRGVVVDALIPLVVFFHYRVRRIRLREFVAVILCGYLFINLMSVARVSSNPLEMLQLIRDAIAVAGPALLGVAATSELWTATNLHRLIEGVASNETQLTYGVSFVNEWSTLLPRFIYPDRPLTLAERFVDVFYPGLLESGGGMGLFILQEGYWAFGLIGIVITMLGFGYFLETLYRLLLTHLNSVPALLLYGFAYSPLVLSSVRNGITGSIKAAGLMMAPILMALLVSKLLSKAGSANWFGSS